MSWKKLPSDISSLSGWWRASDLTGIEGSLIAAWNEVSGQPGFALSQATDSLKPKLIKYHGYGQCVRFDGVDDYLESNFGGGDTFGDLLHTTSKDGTIVTVQRVRPPAGSTQPSHGIWGSNTNGGSGAAIRNALRPIPVEAFLLDSGGRNTASRALEAEYSWNQALATDPPTPVRNLGGDRTGQLNADEDWDVGLPFVALWAHGSVAGLLSCNLNNLDDAHAAAVSSGPPTATDLGAGFRVGWCSDASSGSWYWLGDIFEIITFDAVLSEADRRGLALYLSERYGLPYLSGVSSSEALGTLPSMRIEMQLPIAATEDFDRYPEFLAPPTLWLKADTGVLDSGGSPCSDGEAVAKWEDQSGNGLDLEQATAGNRPVWQDGSSPSPFGANRPYVEFDPASSQFLSVIGGEPDFEDLLGHAGFGSVFVVGYCTYADQSALSTAVAAAIFGHTAAQGPGLRLRDISGVALEGSNNKTGTGMTNANVSTVLNTACAWAWNCHAGYDAAAPATLFVHELANGDSAEANGSVSTGEDTTYLGNDFSLGRGDYSGTTYYWKGYIAEVLVFPRQMNAQMRQMVYTYLGAKYGSGQVVPYAARVWQDVTADVRASEGIRFGHGISGADPTDRVASAGECTLAMENTQANSAGTVGYYSPHHASKRSGFDIGTQLRIVFEWYGTKWIKWHGWITSISVRPGKGNRIVRVTANDWFLLAANAQQLSQSLKEDQYPTWAAWHIHSYLPSPQFSIFYAMDKSTSPYGDVYPIVFDDQRENRSSLGEFVRLNNSRWGYIYERGDAFRGGRVVFEGRYTRSHYPFDTPCWSVDDDVLEDLELSDHTYEGIINQLVATLHPRRVDAAATTVLFVLQSVPVELAAGADISFKAPYRDPESGRSTRVGGTDMVTPVATTDYTANTQPDGSGTNKTSQLGVSAIFYGSAASITLTNNDPATIYVTKFQFRGKGIYYDEAVVVMRNDSDSIVDYGQRSLAIEMPYQQDVAVAEGIGDDIIAAYKEPRSRVRALAFNPRRSAELMMHALAREIGDFIEISETVSGLSASEYHIQGVEFAIGDGGTILCRWRMTPRLLL